MPEAQKDVFVLLKREHCCSESKGGSGICNFEERKMFVGALLASAIHGQSIIIKTHRLI